MKIDGYTKFLLTIIAACLVWLSIGGPSLIPPVVAQNASQRVVLEGWVDTGGYVRSIREFPVPVQQAPR